MSMPAKDLALRGRSVVLADRHPLFRNGVAQALRAGLRLTIAGQCSSAEEAETLASGLLPDLLLLDVQLPGSFEAAEAIGRASPNTKLLVLTDLDTKEAVDRSFQAGAVGYLLKITDARDLLGAVKAVMDGEIYLGPRLIARLIAPKVPALGKPPAPAEEVRLGKREVEIISLLLSGASNKEIAFQLGVGEKTVKYYLTHIMKKLRLRNRVEVALYAARMASTALLL